MDKHFVYHPTQSDDIMYQMSFLGNTLFC